MRYPCAGSPALAKEITMLLGNENIDPHRGLDHGVWAPLIHLFPKADIPVVQLSLDATIPFTSHVNLAKKLLPLRQSNVLIIGSGNIVHNIRRWMSDPTGDATWAVEFDIAAKNALLQQDLDSLCTLPMTHPHGRDAVPSAEHYLPMLYIAGLRQTNEPISMSQFTDKSIEGASMRSFRVG